MDQGYYQQFNGVPIDTFQFYYDYDSWLMNNQNFYSALPAYQELNRPTFVHSFNAESIDLTDEATTGPSPPLSPTQAKDFKLNCEGCERSFTSKKRLQNHMARCNMKTFPCQVCRKNFMNRAGLSRHLKMHINKPMMGQINLPEAPRRSIFHSVQLLAISDCKDSN